MKQTCPELLQLPLGLWFEVRCSFSCLTCLCFVQATIHWPNCSIYRRACLRYPKTPVQIVQILFLADILGVFDLNWRRMQTVTQATFHKWICRTPLCATQPGSIHRKLMIFIQQKFDFNRIKHRFGFQPLRWGFKKKRGNWNVTLTGFSWVWNSIFPISRQWRRKSKNRCFLLSGNLANLAAGYGRTEVRTDWTCVKTWQHPWLGSYFLKQRTRHIRHAGRVTPGSRGR